MILFVVTETAERYRDRNWTRKKQALEQAAGDFCLILHYRQIDASVLRRVRPWAVCHSGAATPYENFDILRHGGYRRLVTHGAVPQLGICGGHQLIAKFFGSRVAPMRRLREEDADHNPEYHPGEFKELGMYPVCIVRRDPLFRGLGAVVRVREYHRSEVKRLGPDLILLASSAECRVQAFVHRRKPIYGVQFHPEESLDEYPDGRRVLENFFRVARAVGRRQE
jgi:GMP synthase-like glutamine amidotransferase